MNSHMKGAAKRLILSLVLAVSVSGCAYYGPPYAAYDPGYYGYSQPYYAGPPISLGLGFGFYDHHGGGHYRGHGWGYGHRGHGGWGHGGWGGGGWQGGGHFRGRR
jgi:hypothetical protein